MNRELKKHIIDWISDKTDFEYGNYSTNKNVLYFKNMVKEPLMRLYDDEKIMVNFHVKVKNPLLKIFNIIEELNIVDDVLFVNYLFHEKEKAEYNKRIYDDFHNMICVYSDEKIYYGLKKYNIVFQDIILNYMHYFIKSSKIFDEMWEEQIYEDPNYEGRSGKLLGKKYDDHYYWGNWGTDEYLRYNIQNEEIRNNILYLKRKMKIKSFLKDIEKEEA